MESIWNMIASISTVLILGVNIFVAVKVIRHFRLKALFDKWLLALSDDYHDHRIKVDTFLHAKHSNKKLVKLIKDDNDLNKSINYILDWWVIKAVSMRHKIMNRKIGIRLSKHQIFFYYEGLKPWIDYRRKEPKHKHIYEDIDWLYNKTKMLYGCE